MHLLMHLHALEPENGNRPEASMHSDLRVSMEPVTGVEPATYGLQKLPFSGHSVSFSLIQARPPPPYWE